MLYSVLNISSFQELRNVGDKLERAGSNAGNCRGTLQSFRSSVLLDPNFYRWRRIRQVLLHIQAQSMLLPEKKRSQSRKLLVWHCVNSSLRNDCNTYQNFCFPWLQNFCYCGTRAKSRHHESE